MRFFLLISRNGISSINTTLNSSDILDELKYTYFKHAYATPQNINMIIEGIERYLELAYSKDERIKSDIDYLYFEAYLNQLKILRSMKDKNIKNENEKQSAKRKDIRSIFIHFREEIDKYKPKAKRFFTGLIGMRQKVREELEHIKRNLIQLKNEKIPSEKINIIYPSIGGKRRTRRYPHKTQRKHRHTSLKRK